MHPSSTLNAPLRGGGGPHRQLREIFHHGKTISLRRKKKRYATSLFSNERRIPHHGGAPSSSQTRLFFRKIIKTKQKKCFSLCFYLRETRAVRNNPVCGLFDELNKRRLVRRSAGCSWNIFSFSRALYSRTSGA